MHSIVDRKFRHYSISRTFEEMKKNLICRKSTNIISALALHAGRRVNIGNNSVFVFVSFLHAAIKKWCFCLVSPS